jgi:presenilin-like A22 family membrane protease
VLLAVLSLYDLIAVYRTHHMATIARALVRGGAAFAVMVPARARSLAARRLEAAPGKEFFFLGTGDLALPAILISSVALSSVPRALAAYAGSLVGAALMLGFFFSQRTRAPMPALPPIAAATAFGYLFGTVFL